MKIDKIIEALLATITICIFSNAHYLFVADGSVLVIYSTILSTLLIFSNKINLNKASKIFLFSFITLNILAFILNLNNPVPPFWNDFVRVVLLIPFFNLFFSKFDPSKEVQLKKLKFIIYASIITIYTLSILEFYFPDYFHGRYFGPQYLTNRTYGPFRDPNFTSFSVIFLCGLLQNFEKNYTKTWLVTVGLLPLIGLLGSRTAMVLITILILRVAFLIKNRRIIFKTCIIIGLFLFAMYIKTFEKYSVGYAIQRTFSPTVGDTHSAYSRLRVFDKLTIDSILDLTETLHGALFHTLAKNKIFETQSISHNGFVNLIEQYGVFALFFFAQLMIILLQKKHQYLGLIILFAAFTLPLIFTNNAYLLYLCLQGKNKC